jgi:myo-inositol-1(or 4)-monophosphatase
VREAGGFVSEIYGGNVLETGNIIAANEALEPLMQERLAAAATIGRTAPA